MNSSKTVISKLSVACVLALMAMLSPSCVGKDYEAKQEAQKAWDNYFTRCRSSYFHARRAKSVLGIRVTPDMLEELGGVTIETERYPIEQADSLNGVEWKGVTRFTASSSRLYDAHSGWTDWRSSDYVLTINLEKRSGSWNIGKASMWGVWVFEPTTKLTCNEIPQADGIIPTR